MPCPDGFEQNIDRTGCDGKYNHLIILDGLLTLFYAYCERIGSDASINLQPAIPPSIEVSVPDEVDSSTYTVEEGDYLVEIGREFQIQCISEGNFSGEVTWLKRNENTGEIQSAN